MQGHTYTNPRPGQYLTHAHSHIARAVAAMDSCLALIRAHLHGITVGSMNGENPRVSKTLYSRGECKHCFKRQLHTTHVGTVRAESRTAVLPRHAPGRRIRTYPDLCASKFNKVNLKQGAHMPWEKEGEKRRPEMRLLFVGY